RDLFIPLTNAEGQVEGGLVGYTGRGGHYVEMLVVAGHIRRHGLGGVRGCGFGSWGWGVLVVLTRARKGLMD
ncbi:MAG: hypothetical protein K0M47_23745, partial [Rhizobium sp.]|nr:hypothetical protein [Rhizobium sp.]